MKLTPKTSVIGAVVAVFALGIIVLAQNQMMVKSDINADMGGDSYVNPTTDSDSDSKPTTPETEGETPAETPTATPSGPSGKTPQTTPNQPTAPAGVCTCSCIRKVNGTTSTLCKVPNTAGTPSRFPTCPDNNANYIVDNMTATQCADLNKTDNDTCDGYSPIGNQNNQSQGDLTNCSIRVQTR